MKHIFMVAFALVSLGETLAFGQTSNTKCVAEHYRVLPLPLRATSINDMGHVAGISQNHRAAIWTDRSGLREIPLPNGLLDAEAVAINHAGHVVGNAHDRTLGRHQAFFYGGGKLTVLSGEQSRAFGINDADVIVGMSVTAPGKPPDPVIWNGNVIQSLAPCCGGAATAVNLGGDAIGNVHDDRGRYHAVLWTKGGGIKQIGPVNEYSTAIAINDYGHAIVQAFSKVFLYADGSLVRLELHPNYPSKPLALNNCDVVVGAFGPFSDADRAFIWDKSLGFRDLNDLISSDSGWKLESATGINNHGAIVGHGDFRGADDTGFLLIPEK